jgi:hypothetical protein
MTNGLTHCTTLATAACLASDDIGKLNRLNERQIAAMPPFDVQPTPRFGQQASRQDSIDVVVQQSHVSAHDAQHS